jgi:hypothetical protein
MSTNMSLCSATFSRFFRLFNSGSLGPVASMPRRYKKKAGFDLEGVAKLSQNHDGEVVLSTLNAISISINSVPMSSSGSVKLRYEKCLQVWGNARLISKHVTVAYARRLELHGTYSVYRSPVLLNPIKLILLAFAGVVGLCSSV